jgi:EmrB/QacA subfamily drug resistance transporter
MTTNTNAAPPSWTEPEPYRYRWVAFAAVLAASVMDLLDTTITNIAAPTIRVHFAASSSLIQWLGAGYTMAMAIGLLAGGRLGDIYGRKSVFLIGAAGFTSASVLCGVSNSPGMLITARVVQGLFGAVMLPQGLGFIKQMFPPKETAAAFGAFGPIMGIASVGGPILGGWLIGANLFGTGWRAIFLINVPVGILILTIGAKFLPTAVRTASRLDWVGAMLASIAVALMIYPVVQGRELHWPAWTFVSMAASVAAFGLFGVFENRVQRSGGEPLVIPGLFRKRAFTGGLVAGLAFFTAITGFALVLTVFLQTGLHYSALGAGLAALPQALGGVIGFVIAGAGLANKLGRTLIHIGTAFMAVGVLAIEVELHLVHHVSAWTLSPMLLVSGIGLGFTLSPFFNIVLAGVEQHETGSASGALTALQQFGGAFGVAALGTAFFDLLHGPGRTYFTHALEGTLWIVAGLQALTFILAFLLPKQASTEWDGEWNPDSIPAA